MDTILDAVQRSMERRGGACARRRRLGAKSCGARCEVANYRERRLRVLVQFRRRSWTWLRSRTW